MKRLKGSRYLPLAVLVVIALVVTVCFPFIAKKAQTDTDSIFEGERFKQNIYQNGFVLYWELMQRSYGTGLSPSDIYSPEADSYNFIDYEFSYFEEYIQYAQMCDEQVVGWRNTFQRNWNGLQYGALDLDSGISIGNIGEDLEDIYDRYRDTGYVDSVADNYQYLAVVYYNPAGQVSIPVLRGAAADSLDGLTHYDLWDHWEQMFPYNDDAGYRYLNLPQDMLAVYAIPKQVVGFNALLAGQDDYAKRAIANAGMRTVYGWALVLSAVLAGIVGWRKKEWRTGNRIPMEFALGLPFVSIAFWEPLVLIGIGSFQNRPGLLDPDFTSVQFRDQVVGLGLVFCLVLLALGMIYISMLSLMQVRHLGLKRYLARECLCIRFVVWCCHVVVQAGRWVVSFDLSDSTNKVALKILLANFALVSILCSFWFAGIGGAAVYTLVLFVIMRRFLDRTRGQYLKLLDTTREMAQGRLDVALEEDMGVFGSLSRELSTIQAGFRSAVEAEVRSQNMRTELVTNVSHDLKTPLTAIITYVGLLKEESATEEERRSYVETLDAKSQRLKRLIEDLFEVSKASSGNMTLHVEPVDLLALVRQVELEYKEEIEAAGIDFRNRFAMEKMLVELDGEKTSRIFENLFINITKYAMPGTRAYVDVFVRDGRIVTEVKNISQEPLELDGRDITERFVRGDLARNTEGSGLGLAIVRSFAELQGGSFSVSADGDLFKATVEFPIKTPYLEEGHNTAGTEG